MENVRFAVINALRSKGASGITNNTADADMLVSVNPSVYSYQFDTYYYRGFLWLTSKNALKQSAAAKLTAVVTD